MEEVTLSADKLALAAVGRQDAKKRLESTLTVRPRASCAPLTFSRTCSPSRFVRQPSCSFFSQTLLASNIVQALGTMLETVVF